MVVGSVPRGKAVLRSGAKVGDQIYVTGELGGAAASLARFIASQSGGAEYSGRFYPWPRIEVGQWLRQRGLASAMIDLSDGLSTDLEHICEESDVGAVVEGALVPRALMGKGKEVPLDMALHGGEDYELLFTSSGKIPAKVGRVAITRIGRITGDSRMRLIGIDGKARRLKAGGWEHFKSNL